MDDLIPPLGYRGRYPASEFRTMKRDEEELLDEAFNAERSGNRIEAIQLYREVASRTSEHSGYAERCAIDLERLGVDKTARGQNASRPDNTDGTSKASNPFQSPNVAPSSRTSALENSNKHRRHFSLMLLRFLCVFCLIAAGNNLIGVFNAYRYAHAESNFWQVNGFFNCMYAINLLALAWFGFRYSAAHRNLLPVSKERLEVYTKHQIAVLLCLATLAILSVLSMYSFLFMY